MAKKKGRPPSGKPKTSDGRLTARTGIPLPDELKQRLTEVAKNNHRSMAQEAVVAIERHCTNEESGSGS